MHFGNKRNHKLLMKYTERTGGESANSMWKNMVKVGISSYIG
jgi:hypothetical protein